MWKKLHTMGLNIFWSTAYLAVSLLFTTAVDDVSSLKNLFLTNMSHSESYLKQLSKFGFNQTPDRLLIDSWLTPNDLQDFFWRWQQISIWRAVPISSPTLVTMGLLTDSQQTTDRLTLNPTTDSKKFVGDDIRSQFGELFKSALQIWRALHISFPNLVSIRLLTDYWLTPDILLTDSWLPPNRLRIDSH